MKKLLGILFLAFSSSLFNLCEGQYTVLHNFNDTLGANSYASLMLSGGTLYGMTSSGGTRGAGCIFSMDTDGSGYSDLFNFNDTNGGNSTV
jgi:uncharacterized repeat protein (TIGR03803 family)